MATLPQTAPGAPEAGIDPTVDELQQIGDVAGIFSWFGSEESLRPAVLRALDGGQPHLRDLVHVLADLWKDTVRNLLVPQGETERDLTALEVGHVRIVRRITRPRLGLTAQECRQLHRHPRGREYWLRFPRNVTAEPRLKLSVLLDPALDSELARLPQAKVQEMFADHVRLRRADPSKDIKPTLEQVGAIHQLIPPTWSLLPISHSSDLMVRGCCANSLTSTGPSCLTALGNGRNCRDHLPSIFGGRHSGCAEPHYLRWMRHLPRSWTTVVKWSGATQPCTMTRGFCRLQC